MIIDKALGGQEHDNKATVGMIPNQAPVGQCFNDFDASTLPRESESSGIIDVAETQFSACVPKIDAERPKDAAVSLNRIRP